MNTLVGEKMSIITPKAQTTRHRIMGILNEPEFQIVFSDTPGIIKPKYEMHEAMMSAVRSSLVDADVLLLVSAIDEQYDEMEVIEKLKFSETPVIVLVNKIDLAKPEQVQEKVNYWQELLNPKAVFAISALKQKDMSSFIKELLELIPEHPPYYDKEELTDRPERFFVSEIIREKIFMNYQKEIPYSTEVVVTAFKEEPKITRISVEIIVERDSQKNILIGPAGAMIKKVGTYSRMDIEKFIDKKVFLELFVKVIPDWRKKSNYLKRFGYEN